MNMQINMDRARRLVFLGCLLCLAFVVNGCSGDDPSGDSGLGDGGLDGDTAEFCSDDAACQDGVFCNGIESCSPSAEGADQRGCVLGHPPCTAEEVCDEATASCSSNDCRDADTDGDGHRRRSCGGDDCDDGDANRYPGNTEVCDAESHDEDCDATTFGFRDQDEDGYVDRECCNEAEDGTRSCGDDCNDIRRESHPGNTEACDGFDNDCDGETDEGVTNTCRVDGDGDGFGTSDPESETREACACEEGYSSSTTDCNDGDPEVHPGARELCNDVDDNCDDVVDGVVEEEDVRLLECECMIGDEEDCGSDVGECRSGRRFCDSGRWGRCEGEIAPVREVCNGLDDDCNGTPDNVDDELLNRYYRDSDSDSFGDPSDEVLGCSPPAGYVVNGADCNDRDAPHIHPGAVEICDGADDNCDGIVDGYLREGGDVERLPCECSDGERRRCGTDEGVCTRGWQTCVLGSWGACDGVGPTSESCNRLDDDCNGIRDDVDESLLTTFYRDSDDDDHGDPDSTTDACFRPSGYVDDDEDCDDGRDDTYEGAVELCDLIDNDCSDGGGEDRGEDRDGDGHAPTRGCVGGDLPPDDCNDRNEDVHGGQTSFFNNGMCGSRERWCVFWTPFGTAGCCQADTGMPCIMNSSACIDNGSYDYNCDRIEEHQPASTGGCVVVTGGWITYCRGGGPIDDSPLTDCGDLVSHRECRYDRFERRCIESFSVERLACR